MKYLKHDQQYFKWKNSDLHDALRNNRQTGLSSGTKFLDIERTVLEKGATAVALEICLSKKALVEV